MDQYNNPFEQNHKHNKNSSPFELGMADHESKKYLESDTKNYKKSERQIKKSTNKKTINSKPIINIPNIQSKDINAKDINGYIKKGKALGIVLFIIIVVFNILSSISENVIDNFIDDLDYDSTEYQEQIKDKISDISHSIYNNSISVDFDITDINKVLDWGKVYEFIETNDYDEIFISYEEDNIIVPSFYYDENNNEYKIYYILSGEDIQNHIAGSKLIGIAIYKLDENYNYELHYSAGDISLIEDYI